ncbi:unnamed protein product [Adineta steineri]|uniref:Uncharacterized protein n=1 Tax=Adineta steineri TaxID=433720 RepID=A0A815N5X6_9BILA|nr:unnamed protein product [Adineta steineri]
MFRSEKAQTKSVESTYGRILAARAEWKSKQNFKLEDVQRGWGTQHTLTGKQAIAAYGAELTTSEIPKMFRNPPIF